MWYIEMGGMYTIKGQKIFGRKLYTTIDKISEHRNKFNNTDVYATVYQYNQEDQNQSDIFGPLYIDLDMDFKNNTEYNKLKRDLALIVSHLSSQYGIPTKYIRFYFTGKKGFHLIIPPKVFGVTPDKNLNQYYKVIAKELNDNTINKIVDTKIYDKKRLLRLVNSINGKTGLYKVPITYSDIIKFTYEDMLEYASSPKTLEYEDVQAVEKAVNRLKEIKSATIAALNKPRTNTTLPTNVDFSKVTFPKCIQEIYKNGCKEGNRNHTTIILASSFLQKGISLETTIDMVHKWNDEKNCPSLSYQEVETTVRSAYNQVVNGRRYGCTAIKDMGLCVGKECKIYK